MSAEASYNRRMRVVWIIVLVIVLGFAATFRTQLSGLLWSIIAPVMHLRFAGTPDAFDTASTTAALADRNALYAENLELKARLGRPGVASKRILAGVVLRPPATPYDSLVIDAGSAEEVAVGDAVSAGGTTLIGTVSEVSIHTARVALYSSPGTQYQAFLNGTVPLTIEGQGGGSMTARVPSGTVVSVGDIAEVPGIMGGLAAKVRAVERNESESFLTLYFTLPADIFGLRYVEVWKQPS